MTSSQHYVAVRRPGVRNEVFLFPTRDDAKAFVADVQQRFGDTAECMIGIGAEEKPTDHLYTISITMAEAKRILSWRAKMHP